VTGAAPGDAPGEVEGPSARTARRVLAVIMLGALLARLIRLDHLGLWYDEGFSVLMVELADPLIWLHTALGEDVLVPMQTKAAGFGLRDAATEGEPFGIRYRGLADTLPRLVSRGFSIIHSVKNDPNVSEGEVREFFRVRREQSKRSMVIFPKAG